MNSTDHRSISQEIEGVRQWYDTVADSFVHRYSGKSGEYFRVFEEDVFTELVPSGALVLDLGCGHGRFSHRITQGESNQAVAVDISLEMLRHSPFHDFPRLQANAAELCFKDACFDTVVSMGMFEYLKHPGPFLMEINRVLRAGGELLFSFHQVKPTFQPPPEDGEAPYFGKTVHERNALWTRVTRTYEEMKTYLEHSGFRVDKVRRVFFRLPTKLFSMGLGVRRFSGRLGGGLIACSRKMENLMALRYSQNSNGNTIILARKRQ